MKKKIFLLLLCCGFIVSCKDFLDQQPQGAIDGDQLNTPGNVEKMVIAAYSAVGNDQIHTSYSLWPWGSMRSGDAYKGGDGPGDNSEWNDYELFVTNRPDNSITDQMWAQLYAAISRVNDALRRVNAIDETSYPQKAGRQAELRFLRGHFYFMLKILYKHVPFIDETAPKTSYDTISNVGYANDALWSKIAEEFRYAAANLPVTQEDAGRPIQAAAKAYLAKTLLYQAYQQDEHNNVTNIDAAKLTEVNSLCDEVISSGKFGLAPDFAQNFLSQYENGPESIFAIQFSKGDGTPFGRIDMGHALSYPMNQEFGCCWQHIPSQDMVNAFKTDANGLPMFNGYNGTDAVEGNDFLNQAFDPRLDHTVAIPGHPWKYKPNFVYQKLWARAPQIYGPFTSLKECVAPDDPSFQKIPPFMSSSKNWELIRYADVLLWKAEALIELGRQNEALPLINQVRQRAAASTGLLKQNSGSFTSNYRMGTYQPGVNCTWTKDFARQALRWERRLEFAMEGCRFFDLVRWGIAAEYLNAYFTSESVKRPHLSTAHFQKGRDEYLPIPLNQMNYSKGLYKQNAGW
ncbi:RagB/SusD family nutrient uptake outer membrane protein [Chitinophaga agrisoli]|uniref:RagB/SusD family nutrient uptake outer membrane protein n=1 Tax=Chitinophaga agrisoli TaxID=2607653 RepID=A0A5B2VVY7_9BACT|nr:RagB/SusD family nutrient uptake outer membrane protein [Chitinophaga agrisoli]KAA2242748.1 RagB/SusD family nutrient uptake outer membrane protein [Chitinophaga agrisoli]